MLVEAQKLLRISNSYKSVVSITDHCSNFGPIKFEGVNIAWIKLSDTGCQLGNLPSTFSEQNIAIWSLFVDFITSKVQIRYYKMLKFWELLTCGCKINNR